MTTVERNGVEPRTLGELHRRRTRYEVVASTPAGTYRLGFAVRTGRRELLGLARTHAALLVPHLGAADAVRYSVAAGLRLGAVRVYRSGRTERECALLERPAGVPREIS